MAGKVILAAGEPLLALSHQIKQKLTDEVRKMEERGGSAPAANALEGPTIDRLY